MRSTQAGWQGATNDTCCPGAKRPEVGASSTVPVPTETYFSFLRLSLDRAKTLRATSTGPSSRR